MRLATVPRPRSRRALLAAMTAATLLDPSVTAARDIPEAERFVQALADRTVAVLGRPALDQAGRTAAMAEILSQAVDLGAIARVVLGRHWTEAAEAQRADYVRLFQPYAIGILAQRFGAYTGTERFVVTGSRPVGDGDRMVSTEVRYTGGYPPLHLDWRVRTDKDRPRILDVVAEGVSWILTYRSEFEAIIDRGGFDGLLREMGRRATATGSTP